MQKGTTIQERYVKLEQRDHVYQLPDTYIGSAMGTQETMYVYDDSRNQIISALVEYVPGLYKIIDELIVNACDQHQRLLMQHSECPVTTIAIELNMDTGEFSIRNDGDGIDVVQHPEHKIWIVEMIFGHLLTSTNYHLNDENAAVMGGKNGYGAKLANVFSTYFQVETVDRHRQLYYQQTFEENMKVIHPPVITPWEGKDSAPFTKISMYPDFSRFQMERGWTSSMYSIVRRRAFDLAALMPRVQITFNGEVVNCRSFEHYMKYYLPGEEDIIYEKCHDRWEIGVVLHDGYEHVSFVNGIFTSRGGKHVEYITLQLCKKVMEWIEKKKKIKVKINHIRENIMVFVKCLINNPSFDSQTKETLTTPVHKFGSRCEVSEGFIQKMVKGGLVERVLKLHEFKEQEHLSRSEGKKRSKLLGIDKLEDANEAGGPRSSECTLILTEGDSAKGTAMSGLEVVGRDLWGVFPLKGKLINVRDKSTTLKGKEQLNKNEELNHLKIILGLETNKVYQDTSSLRYGKVMLMTDQDVDGSHIKGLFINWIDTCWPSLLQLNYITCLVTPIIKAKKGKEVCCFYSMGDYFQWKAREDIAIKQWEIKYYKGLGTSDHKEAKDYFRSLKQIHFECSDQSREKIDLAFNKNRSDDRKEWLSHYEMDQTTDVSCSSLPLHDFVDLELKHFSNYDLHRSIGHLMDGLKPSQRKILYACFKRNLTKEIKVAQLAGYVSEHTGYHHGEDSLHKAIVAMAQTYVGSNNINYLMPNGQFGTRLENGKDHASSRYIFTCLNPLMKTLYPEDDFPLLDYINDDGTCVEPRFYTPILPTVLMNGNCGVGTGYSTDIPCYNPMEIAEQFVERLRGERGEFTELVPFYQQFKGTIHRMNNTTYITKGRYVVSSYKTLDITELPIGTWTNDYRMFLETLVSESKQDKKIVKSIRNYCTDSRIHFILEIDPENLKGLIKNKTEDHGIDAIEKYFRLSTKLSINNMHLFSVDEIIQKYDCTVAIMESFYHIRREFYVKRILYQLDKVDQELKVLQNKIRFIQCIIQKDVILHQQSKDQLMNCLESMEFDRVHDSYDYLISMPLYSLTIDMIHQLNDKCVVKQSLHDDLQSIKPETLWEKDIQQWMKEYRHSLQKMTMLEQEEREQEGESSSVVSKNHTKKGGNRGRKKNSKS